MDYSPDSHLSPSHSASSAAAAAAATATATAAAPPPSAIPAADPDRARATQSKSTISESDIHALLAYFWSFNPSTTPRDAPDLAHIHAIVTRLFARDYDLALIHNDWCSSYPQQLIIPTRHLSSPSSHHLVVNNPTTLAPLFRNSRFSRVRSRFVVPVLILNGRNICRSSTLSNEAEVQLNSIAEKAKFFKRQLFSSGATADAPSSSSSSSSNGTRPRSPASPPSTSQPSSDVDDPALAPAPSGGAGDTLSSSLSTMERQRLADIALLRALQVTDIFDLMVENRKVKAFFTITSSEKADTRNRYAEFAVVPIPYPGVEFFQDFKSRGYCGKELKFDWMQAFADAELKVERAGAWRRQGRGGAPSNNSPGGNRAGGGLIGASPSVEVLSNVELWKEWRNWDIIRMTQHYLQLILHSLVAPSPSTASGSSSPQTPSASPSIPSLPADPPTFTPSSATLASPSTDHPDPTTTHPDLCPPPTAPTEPRLSGNGGINIHCISGWDRTPAFVSWVRLSLWADGLAHESLCAEEILYLTVAYDWLLFSHLLADRVKNSQEIFAFCFYMLLYILDEREFGVAGLARDVGRRGGGEQHAAGEASDESVSSHQGSQAPQEQASVGWKSQRLPSLSTSAPTSATSPPLPPWGDATHEAATGVSPTLSDFFAHTQKSPPHPLAASLSTTTTTPPIHLASGCSNSAGTRPMDVPSAARPSEHILPHRPVRRRPSHSGSGYTPPLVATAAAHASVASAQSSSSSLLLAPGRRTSHDSLALDATTPPRSAPLLGLGGGGGDSVSSAASSLCSVPCQLDVAGAGMVNGRSPAGGHTPSSAAAPAAQYSSSWQLISYMQQLAQQAAVSTSNNGGSGAGGQQTVANNTPRRPNPTPPAATGRARAPSTGSLHRHAQHRYSHSWTLEDGGPPGCAAGSVSPAIAPSLGPLFASSPPPPAAGGGGVVHARPRGLLLHTALASSPSSSAGVGTPPMSPVLDHDPLASLHTPSGASAAFPPPDDDVEAVDADIDDDDYLEFAYARRAAPPTTDGGPRKQHVAPEFGHPSRPSPMSLTGAGGNTGSWSWTGIASKETTPSPVVVPSVPPPPPPPPSAQGMQPGAHGSSASSSSSTRSRWSLGTSGGVMLAAPQAQPMAAAVVSGGRIAAVGFPLSTNGTPVSASPGSQHARRQLHERKRTLSLSGSWDPYMSPITPTSEVGVKAQMAAPSVRRPQSTPVRVSEAKQEDSGMDFAPFSACGCCQMPGSSKPGMESTPGGPDEEDLFAMDGSLMLVPGPSGSERSTESTAAPRLLAGRPSEEDGQESDLISGSSMAFDDSKSVDEEPESSSGHEPKLSSSHESQHSSVALLSTARAQRLLRVRNLFVEAYRPLAQPITAPPLSTKDWPPLPSRPLAPATASSSSASASASALSLAGADGHMRPSHRGGTSPLLPPSQAQPQQVHFASAAVGGTQSGGRWTSSLSSMMAKMTGVPAAPPPPAVASSQPLSNGSVSPPTVTPTATAALPPLTRASPVAPAPPPLHAHYMQPLTTILPTPPMSTTTHSSSSSSSSATPNTGLATAGAGMLTMPPSWRSVHQQLQRATSPAAAGPSGLHAHAPPPVPVPSSGGLLLGGGNGYGSHHYMSPLVSPIGGAGASGGGTGVFRSSAPSGGGDSATAGGTSGIRDSWFR